jgi:hypothetical protein
VTVRRALGTLGTCGVLAVASGACIHVGPAPDRGGCYRGTEAIVMSAARNAVADRNGENRFRLPWTDTLPPQVVRDAPTCRAAAVGYAAGRLPPGVAPWASVVRAGGLYFVLGPVEQKAGESTIVGVLDAHFRWLVGITT